MKIKIVLYNNESRTLSGVVAFDFDGETGELKLQCDDGGIVKCRLVKEAHVVEH